MFMSIKSSESRVLALEHYMPYRLSILSNRVSSIIAEAYKDKFGLSITEWRIMAVLGEYPGVSADEVSSKTQIEKSMISRAIQKLLDRSLVNREIDAQDRRRHNLKLTERGLKVYDEIVPMSYDYETRLLDCFTEMELMQLDSLIGKLYKHAGNVENEMDEEVEGS